MHRTIVLFAVWTLQIVPIFCLGGLLSHACNYHVESRCSHEDDCAVDPCASSVRPSERAARDASDALTAVSGSPLGLAVPLLAAIPLGNLCWESTGITSEVLSARFLPLLI